MKFTHLLIVALFGVFITIIACKDKKDDATTEEQTTVSPDGTMTQDPSTVGTVSSGNEPHYKCPTAGCTGKGGEGQGKCSVCGADLVHNQGFHSQGATTPPGSSPVNPVQVNPTTGSTQPTTTPAPPAAQNAQGVFHYTCPKGHAGGAAVAGSCATCGGPLEHNQAYHN